MADIRVVIQKPLVGPASGVQTVTGANVDNTDPENPVINQDSNKVDSILTNEPTGSDKVLNMVSLTQSEYDAGTPIATTFYIITDA